MPSIIRKLFKVRALETQNKELQEKNRELREQIAMEQEEIALLRVENEKLSKQLNSALWSCHKMRASMPSPALLGTYNRI